VVARKVVGLSLPCGETLGAMGLYCLAFESIKLMTRFEPDPDDHSGAFCHFNKLLGIHRSQGRLGVSFVRSRNGMTGGGPRVSSPGVIVAQRGAQEEWLGGPALPARTACKLVWPLTMVTAEVRSSIRDLAGRAPINRV